jgi:putative phage-type endonuclease
VSVIQTAVDRLGDRRTYLGATDIAAVVGVSPWASAIDIYRQKVEGIEVDATAEMMWGLLLEDAICDGYTEQEGRELFRRNEVVHPDYPFLRFHPDRLVRGEPGVFDAKATWQRGGGKYGEPGTDQVPPQVRVQMVLYSGATKREWADVGLLRRPPLAVYRVPADPVLYDWLIAEAVRFWTEHVEAKVPPPPDGSESYRHYLAERHPKAEEIEMVATPEQQLLVDELRAAMGAEKKAAEHAQLLKNRLMDAMGPAAVLLAPGARITWRNSAPSPRWKEIAGRLGYVASLDVEAYRLADIEGRIGSRRFLPTFSDEEEMEEAA